MTKLPPLSDQSKIGLLAIGILVVFGNVLWRSTHSQPPASSEQIETLSPVEGGTSPNATGADKPKPNTSMLTLADAPLPTVDAFREVLPKDSGRRATSSPPAYQQRAETSAAQHLASLPMPRSEIGGSLGLAPLPVPGNPSPGSSASAGATANPVEPALPEIRLTGIITGASPVAMITFAGKPYVARVGQLFAPGARLIRIDGRAAVVDVAGQKLNLKL